MFQQKSILIVEDETLLAFAIEDAVNASDGIVIGPYPTVAAALQAIQTFPVAGAILDVQLADRDVTPLALHLLESGVPIVFHTGTGLPSSLADQCAGLPVLSKPTPVAEIIQRLLSEMEKLRPGAHLPE